MTSATNRAVDPSLVRFFAKTAGQRFPPPDQVANGDRLFRVNQHERPQRGDFGGDHCHGLVDRPARQAIGLVQAEGVPGQDNALVGFLVGHEAHADRPRRFGQSRVAQGD